MAAGPQEGERLSAPKGRVLIVAGSDSGGGAGIQADLKTVLALGGYGMTAITALTAQNTTGVTGVHPVPQPFIRAQIDAVMTDLGADAVKTGMLGTAETVETVVAALKALPGTPPQLIADPVMVAKGGDPLLDATGIDAIRALLVPMASVLTPNLPEAEVLTGLTIDSDSNLRKSGEACLKLGAQAVLMKGGHADFGTQDGIMRDVLMAADGSIVEFEAPRIDTRHTHGTGCTTASAIATGLAQGLSLADACRRAHAYVQRAIREAPGLGRGHGPLHHGHTVGHFDGW